MNGQGLSTKGVLFSGGENTKGVKTLTFNLANALVWWRVDHLVLVGLGPTRVQQ